MLSRHILWIQTHVLADKPSPSLWPIQTMRVCSLPQLLYHFSIKSATCCVSPRVTAQPDMRCLLVSRTTGNADGLGATRCRELRKTAAFLGFNAHNVVIVDSPAMQDGLSTQWKPAVAARHISNFVSERNIKHVAEQLHVDLSESAPQVFTFDDGGVSGHPNHIAVAKGAV